MGRPKKQQDLVAQIEKEAELGMVSTDTVSKEPTGSIAVAEVPKANEFNDDYTLKVNMDYDPSSDIFRVPTPNPEYEYRFLRDDQKNMSIKTSNLLKNKGGWQPVPKAHLLKCGFDAERLSADGLYRVGELILAFMPKRLYEVKKADEIQRTTSRMDNIINQGMTGDEGQGIKSGQMDSGKVSFRNKSKREVVFTTREE